MPFCMKFYSETLLKSNYTIGIILSAQLCLLFSPLMSFSIVYLHFSYLIENVPAARSVGTLFSVGSKDDVNKDIQNRMYIASDTA